MTGYLRGRLGSRGTYSYLPDQGFQPYTTLNFNHYFFYVFSHRKRTPRDHHPVDGDQYSRHGWDFRAMEEITRHGTTTLQHTTKRILGASGGCESHLLKKTKERSVCNLCDEVNPSNRHVAALKIGVPSPPVACDYELSVNVGNVGKLRNRHRLPVSRARQRISLFLIHSLFGVSSGKVTRVSKGL